MTKSSSTDRVREHLSNETAYLVWMRVAIALMGFAMVVVRLRAFRTMFSIPSGGWKLGLIFAVTGIVVVLLSTQHYFAVRYEIEQDVYAPANRWILLFSIGVALLSAGVITYVFTASLAP